MLYQLRRFNDNFIRCYVNKYEIIIFPRDVSLDFSWLNKPITSYLPQEANILFLLFINKESKDAIVEENNETSLVSE